MHWLHQSTQHINGSVTDPIIISLQSLGNLPANLKMKNLDEDEAKTNFHLLSEASQGGEASVPSLARHQPPQRVELLLQFSSRNTVLVTLLGYQRTDGGADQLLLIFSKQVFLKCDWSRIISS